MFPALKAVGTSAKPERPPMKYLAVSILVGTGSAAAAVVLTSTCRPLGTHSADVVVFAVNTPGDKAQTVVSSNLQANGYKVVLNKIGTGGAQ